MSTNTHGPNIIFIIVARTINCKVNVVNMGQMVSPAAWVSYLIGKRVRYLNPHPGYECYDYVDPRVSIGSCTLEINWMADCKISVNYIFVSICHYNLIFFSEMLVGVFE